MHYVGLSIVLMMGKMLRGESSNHKMYILLEEFEVPFEQDEVVDIQNLGGENHFFIFMFSKSCFLNLEN